MKKILALLIIIASSMVSVYACTSSNLKVDYNDGVYHIVFTGDKIKKNIEFVSSPTLITNKEAHNNSKSLLTINAGFFDPKNQKTISYIVYDTQVV